MLQVSNTSQLFRMSQAIQWLGRPRMFRRLQVQVVGISVSLLELSMEDHMQR